MMTGFFSWALFIFRSQSVISYFLCTYHYAQFFFIVNKLQFTSFIHESQIGRESMNAEVRLDFNIKKGEFCMVGLKEH